jgi:hypothetical protein
MTKLEKQFLFQLLNRGDLLSILSQPADEWNDAEFINDYWLSIHNWNKAIWKLLKQLYLWYK